MEKWEVYRLLSKDQKDALQNEHNKYIGLAKETLIKELIHSRAALNIIPIPFCEHDWKGNIRLQCSKCKIYMYDKFNPYGR